MGDSRESLVLQYRMSMIRQPDYMAIEKMRANQEKQRARQEREKEPEKGKLTDDVRFSINFWSNNGYKAIRNGTRPQEREILENFVQGHSYEKRIFRGIESNEPHNEWKKGALVDQKGLSSWSTDDVVAETFADLHEKPYRFIYVMDKGTKKGADIQDYSAIPYEKEILVSGTSQQRITKRMKKGRFIYLYCEEV